jgi:hypothetical protein
MEVSEAIPPEKTKGSSSQDSDSGGPGDIPTPPATDVNVSEEYESALRELSAIVDSSDNTFKRDYAGVIWKDLTVCSDVGDTFIAGQRFGFRREHKPDLWWIVSCPS